jgi:exodeoxyribonuclease V beta subunit
MVIWRRNLLDYTPKGTAMGFDVLDPKTGINAHMLIEASAGTGKTYTIEHLFVRRCLEEGQFSERIFAKNCAVLTFTRACAKELVARIRDALDLALSILQTPDRYTQVPGYIQKILDGGYHQIREAKKKVFETKAQLDSSVISTLHGFCIRVLEDFTKNDALHEDSLWTNASKAHAVIYDVLTHHVSEKVICSKQLHILLKRYKQDFSALLDMIYKKLWDQKYLVHAESILTRDYTSISQALLQSLEKFADEKGYSAENVLNFLENAASEFKGLQDRSGITKNEVQNAFCFFAELLKKGASDDNVQAFLHSPLIFSDTFASPKVRKAATNSEALQFIAYAKQHFDPLIKALAHPGTIMKLLLIHIRPKVVKQLRLNGVATFDDLIEQVLEKCSDPSFKAYMKERFQALIIDEFQDTDPHQWKMVHSLFLENADWLGYLYLVGDPKQAIYAFRKADVYSYMSAKAQLLADSSFTLLKNYRSSSHVVAALNTIFCGPHSPHLFYLPKLNESLHVDEVKASGTVEELELIDTKKAVHFFVVKGALGRKRTWPTEELEEAIIFPFIANEIVNLTQKSISLETIAILVKDKYQAARLQSYLGKASISASSWRPDSVISSPAFLFFKRLIYAISRPRDIGALTHLFCHEPFHFSEYECKKFQGSSEEGLFYWAECVRMLSSLKHLFEKEGLGSFFSTLMSYKVPIKERLVSEFIHAASSYPGFSKDLNHIFDICVENEYAFGTLLDRLLNFLDDLEEKSQEEKDLYPSRHEPQEVACNILTMHKSKGLEFNVVFALGAASRTKAGSNDEEDSLNNAELIFESDQEKSRQLYVACTRAKKRLYLPVPLDLDEKKPTPGTMSCIELLLSYSAQSRDQGNGTLSSKEIYDQVYSSYSTDLLLEGLNLLKQASDHISISEELPIHLDRKKSFRNTVLLPESSFTDLRQETLWLKSFSSLKDSIDEAVLKEDLEEENRFLATGSQINLTNSDFPRGAQVGTLMHELVAKILQNISLVDSYDTLISFIKEELGGTILEKYIETVSRLLFRLFHTPLLQDDLEMTLCSIDHSHTFCEMEFILQEESKSSYVREFLRGTIDFVFEWKNRFYIVDWKTNFLGSSQDAYSPVHLQRAIKDRKYDIQAKVYAQALSKYLAAYGINSNDAFGGVLFIFLRSFLFDDEQHVQSITGVVHLRNGVGEEAVFV